jgi:serine/threonine-protein kinase
MNEPTACRIAALVALALPLASPAAPLPQFPPGAVWNQDVSHAPLAADSASMISTLQGLGGWGNGGVLQIDLSMFVLHAAAGAPSAPLVAWPDAAGYYSPDCDTPGFAFPLPAGGAIEGSAGYACDHDNEDCHLLVVQGNTLYEAYAANVAGGGVQSICAIRWNLGRRYPREGRGEQCTSADAAGFPIAPLLFNADEVAAAVAGGGDIGHAIRFILPNARIARDRYVHPATHGTHATSGPAASVPYGVRMRLKSSFDMSRYNPAAKVLLRTMQRYGVVLADGGNIALTGEADRFTTAKWSALGIDEHVFVDGSPAPQVTDFEVVETGPQHGVTYDCARIADDFLFIDGYDY